MVGRPGCTSQAGSVPAQSGSQCPGPAGADCSCTSGRNHIKSSTGALSSFLTLHFYVSSYSCCHRNINKYSDVYNCEQNGLGKKKENGLRCHQSSVCVHCAACLSSMAKAAPAPTARGTSLAPAQPPQLQTAPAPTLSGPTEQPARLWPNHHGCPRAAALTPWEEAALASLWLRLPSPYSPCFIKIEGTHVPISHLLEGSCGVCADGLNAEL